MTSGASSATPATFWPTCPSGPVPGAGAAGQSSGGELPQPPDGQQRTDEVIDPEVVAISRRASTPTSTAASLADCAGKGCSEFVICYPLL